MDYFRASNYLDPGLTIRPQPGYECHPEGWETNIEAEVKIPRLFRTYLNYGAKIYSPPAIDRVFKTIDFFVMLDISMLDDRTREIFFGD